MSQEQFGANDPALRAEHDALSRELAVRPSVDVLRRAWVQGFLGLTCAGLAWALLWDRYGKTPTEFALQHTAFFHVGWIVAALAAVTLFFFFGFSLRRWRRMARDEERRFARLCEVRRALGIDP
jgi:hypothetical protein